MNSWEIIRKQMVKGRAGTIGEMADLNKAADLFTSLNDAGVLMDSKKACDSFNADEALRKSLLMRGAIKEVAGCL